MYLLLFLACWPTAGSQLSVVAPAANVRQVAPRLYTGRVLNQAREPLSGATVLVQGIRTVVSTNADGTFLLPLALGPHTLVVDYPSCRRVVLPVLRPDSALVVIMYRRRLRCGTGSRRTQLCIITALRLDSTFQLAYSYYYRSAADLLP